MKNGLQLQIELYRNLKREVATYLEKQPASLRRYEKEFLKDLSKLEVTSRRELFSAFKSVDFVFFGDFHTLRQSQRFMLRLLRDRGIPKPRALGLEVLDSRGASLLQSWFKTRSTKSEQMLRGHLKLESGWGSHWPTYKEIFSFCDENKITLIPLLNRDSDVRRRDRKAAEQLARVEGPTWVLMGEHHCARMHLPAECAKRVCDASMLIIQQNEDRATLRHLEDVLLQKTLVLRAPVGARKNMELFCVAHTPLWIKYQSFLDRHLNVPDPRDLEHEGFDPHEQIQWCLKTVSQFFEDPRYPLPKSAKYLLDFDVYSPEQPDFFKSLSKFSHAARQNLLHELQVSGVATLADQRKIYLSEITINSCAQAAGLFLYQMWSGTKWEPDEFFKRTLAEALAFLISKILNHSRRSVSWQHWQIRLQSARARQEALSILKARQFLDHRHNTSAWVRLLKPFHVQASVALGRILGDAAFEAFLTGELAIARIVRLLRTSIKLEEDAHEILVELHSIGRSFQQTSKRW